MDKQTYNSGKHHRRSIRLQGYDYAQAGSYFITICTQNRACLFGAIVNGEMILNDAGLMVEKWFLELENKFPDIRCDEYIVMPNHFHGIITIVGADQRVCPVIYPNDNLGEHKNALGKHVVLGEHVGSPLHRAVQWFKTMATNEYIRGVKNQRWPRFNGKLFQRNYYEHIIRNKRSYLRIAAYIRNNPANWKSDKLRS